MAVALVTVLKSGFGEGVGMTYLTLMVEYDQTCYYGAVYTTCQCLSQTITVDLKEGMRAKHHLNKRIMQIKPGCATFISYSLVEMKENLMRKQ